MNYYAALDVSLRSVHLCVIDDKGEIQAEAKLDSEVEDIVAFLRALDLEISVYGLLLGCKHTVNGRHGTTAYVYPASSVGIR